MVASSVLKMAASTRPGCPPHPVEVQPESNKRIKKKPAPLSAKQRAALREQLKEVHFLKPDYADNTKINIAGILRKWKAAAGGNRDNEKKKLKDGSYEDLWDDRVRNRDEEDTEETGAALDENSHVPEGILTQETEGRGRPKALCYEDVLLMVVRHPETGEDVLAMAVKLIYYKGADNKPKPTIFFFTATRRLMFCPILVIISLPLADGAFAALNLTSPSQIFQIKNRGPVTCTPFRWKRDWLKRPIFPEDDMKRQTLDAGFEDAIGPKAFRRGAANVANGNAPDAVRDQMMRHDPKWATFNSASINEKVQFDLQNAFLDESLEDGLVTLFTRISIMRDPRASYDMVPEEVWNALPLDPDIAKLVTQRTRLKNGKYRMRGTDQEGEVQRLTKEIKKKRAQRNKALRQEYRKYYFHNRPTWDIERQLAEGAAEELEEDIQPPIQLCIPERAQLAEILCHQPDNLNANDLRSLRTKAAELLSTLCNKKETAKRKVIR
ncbi:hypothetical protein DL764_007526 [Monosporascus ibericus]|uniref:Uncharacterized protein n=1 Tax=Monosporascus ibericus TaxID=155417 RepID=A0A4Q4T258_9PEZI|nr:hypothetical protein DL764_007526 [Monosporascus ibericus]